MTGIVGMVADGAVWLAGDRAAVADGHYFSTVAEPKVFRNGDYVMGFTNSFRMGQILQYHLTPPEPPRDAAELHRFMTTTFADAVRAALKDAGWLKVEHQREETGQYLVGVSGRLFTADEDFNFHSREDGFDACGSGISVALGAMFATALAGLEPADRLCRALAAAQRFTSTVREPFDVICLPAAGDVVLKQDGER